MSHHTWLIHSQREDWRLSIPIPKLIGEGCSFSEVCWRLSLFYLSLISMSLSPSLSFFPFLHLHPYTGFHHSAMPDSPTPTFFPLLLPYPCPHLPCLLPTLSVLVAEVIKFYFPKMVEMHNYVPANSIQQKLSNWGHLNRKVLNKLNFSVPDDMMRKIAQCVPGVVELVLIPLRQRLEERQRHRKQGVGSLQELAPQDGSGYVDVGLSQKARGEGALDPQGGGQLRSPKRSRSYWPRRRPYRSCR
ncbi:sperm flagellar protein 1 isoform X2 [Cebus imitator]|uniref:sperm flagellar protein 1 isoform X2 n=1 Tax=Cebus imitator TaxID=2715852 RepID=UPI000809E90D|nr:sperm flagellar protein 1 isoform X2 [Cebus imitator]